MLPSLPLRKRPVKNLTIRQIAYVTDNDRDAEAICHSTDSPVVLTRDAREPLRTVRNVTLPQASQTLGTSRRFGSRNVFNAQGVSNVRNVETLETPQDFSGISDAHDASDVQTPDL